MAGEFRCKVCGEPDDETHDNNDHPFRVRDEDRQARKLKIKNDRIREVLAGTNLDRPS